MKVNTLDIFFQVVVHTERYKEKNLQETNFFPAVIMSDMDLKAVNVVFVFLICIFLVHLKGEVMKTVS